MKNAKAFLEKDNIIFLEMGEKALEN